MLRYVQPGTRSGLKLYNRSNTTGKPSLGYAIGTDAIDLGRRARRGFTTRYLPSNSCMTAVT